MDRKKNLHSRFLIWLAAAALLPYLPLLRGEYLYDDIQVIESNAQLKKVTSFGDCFSFVLKPSKPVTNFLLAVGQWLGGGEIFPHRLISLLVHLGVVWLLYFNLVLLRRRIGRNLPRSFPFWVALLFAVLPVHSEAMGIILFRMEMLGALFTLGAMYALQQLMSGKGNRLVWFSVLFFCQGLGPFSKEVFLLVLPASLALVVVLTPRRKVAPARLLWGLGVVQAFWSGVMLWLLLQDHKSDFPYADVVGKGVLDGELHVKLAATALWEGIVKTISGYGITIVRLRDRFGALGALSPPAAAAGLIAAAVACAAIATRGRWYALWAGVFVVGAGVYLAIPNINIGSEHYWYYPSAALLVLLVSGLWRAWASASRRPARFVPFLVVIYALALVITLEKRLLAMNTRLEFYLAEVERHPETASLWSDVGMALMEKGPAYLPEVKRLIEKGKTLEPTHPNVLTAEFLYFFHSNDLKGAENSLKVLLPLFETRPKFLGRFHFHYGLMQEKAGKASEAALSYLNATKHEPGSPIYREAYEKVARH